MLGILPRTKPPATLVRPMAPPRLCVCRDVSGFPGRMTRRSKSKPTPAHRRDCFTSAILQRLPEISDGKATPSPPGRWPVDEAAALHAAATQDLVPAH